MKFEVSSQTILLQFPLLTKSQILHCCQIRNIINLLEKFICLPVNSIIGGINTEYTETEFPLKSRELKSRIDHPWCRCCIENLGFPYVLVSYSFERQLKENGNDFANAQQLLETLWYFNEEMQERHFSSVAEYVHYCAVLQQSRHRQSAAPAQENSTNPSGAVNDSSLALPISQISSYSLITETTDPSCRKWYNRQRISTLLAAQRLNNYANDVQCFYENNQTHFYQLNRAIKNGVVQIILKAPSYYLKFEFTQLNASLFSLKKLCDFPIHLLLVYIDSSKIIRNISDFQVYNNIWNAIKHRSNLSNRISKRNLTHSSRNSVTKLYKFFSQILYIIFIAQLVSFLSSKTNRHDPNRIRGFNLIPALTYYNRDQRINSIPVYSINEAKLKKQVDDISFE